eukprot:gene9692-2814_t
MQVSNSSKKRTGQLSERRRSARWMLLQRRPAPEEEQERARHDSSRKRSSYSRICLHVVVGMLATFACAQPPGAAAVPLARALLEEIMNGKNESSIVTSIPDEEFRGFGGNVTLGRMSELGSIGDNAFRDFKGVLTVDAGDCPKLASIGQEAFRSVSNAASKVSFGAMPELGFIGDYAFSNIKGVLTVDAGDCPKLASIGSCAFCRSYSVSNAASKISFGAMPELGSIGISAFRSFNGVLTVAAGDCPKLVSIGSSAFYQADNAASKVSFGAMPELGFIADRTFGSFKGVLTVDAGDCPKLASIEPGAFRSVSNAASKVAFGAMPKLGSIGGGYGAFNSFKGVLTVAAGDCPKLVSIGSYAFYQADNAASKVSFGAMPELGSIGKEAFSYFNGVLTVAAGDCPKLASIGYRAFESVINPSSSVTISNLTGLTTASSGSSFPNFYGAALLSGPFDSYTGPCINLGAAGTTIYAAGEVPLTQARYSAIANGDETEASITCIPSYEFQAYTGNVTLGRMPELGSIGVRAFSYFKGVLTVDAGDCPKLASIEQEAFRSVSNAASRVSFGAMPELGSIGIYAFGSFKGVLTVDAGDCPKLASIGSYAFNQADNAASKVSFGAMPELGFIGDYAFSNIKGVLTVDAGDCPKLASIGSNAFRSAFEAFRSVSNAASKVAFGAMPELGSIGGGAFDSFKGVLTVDAGDCPKLASIGADAFYSAINAASKVSFTGLVKLASIGTTSFSHSQGTVNLQFDSANSITSKSAIDFSKLNAVNPKSYIMLPYRSQASEWIETAAKAGGFAGQVIFGESTTSTTTATTTTTTRPPGRECSAADIFHNPDAVAAYCAGGSICRYNCCAPNTAESCRACVGGGGAEGIPGACYPHLQLVETPPTPSKPAASAAEWSTRLNVRELYLPPLLKLDDCAIVRGSQCYTNAVDDGGAAAAAPAPPSPPSAAASNHTLKYKLRWGLPSRDSYDLQPLSDESTSFVGGPPPLGLHDSGAGHDPGLVTIDAATGQIAATPLRPGNYTLWMIAYDPVADPDVVCETKAAASETVPREYDQVVLSEWHFEVTSKPDFRLAFDKDPNDPARPKRVEHTAGTREYTDLTSGDYFFAGE